MSGCCFRVFFWLPFVRLVHRCFVRCAKFPRAYLYVTSHGRPIDPPDTSLRYIAINYASAIASWMIEGNKLYVWYSLVGSMAHWYLFTFISVIKPACMHGRRLHIIDNNHAHWYLFTFIQDLSFIYDTCTCVQFYSSIMICEHV